MDNLDGRSAAPAPDSVLPHPCEQERRRSLAALAHRSVEQLRAEWQRLYRALPPKCGADLLIRGIAQRLQEREQGGLSKMVRRRLSQVCDGGAHVKPRQTSERIRPGTRLVRTWQGRTYSVLITEDGYVFQQRTYRSLTPIACEITGTNWSGPKFFGLRDAAKEGAGDARA